MQYQVDPMDQTREMGHKPNGSFKKLIPVPRRISLKINRAFPGHAVFAGMSTKACSIILDVNELGAVP